MEEHEVESDHHIALDVRLRARQKTIQYEGMAAQEERAGEWT